MDTRTTTPIDASIESTFRALLDRQAAAWNRGDAIDWGGAFSETADFVNIRGQVFGGRAAIVEQHARIFAGPFMGSRTKIAIPRMVQIAPTIVLLDTTHEVTGFKFLPPALRQRPKGSSERA